MNFLLAAVATSWYAMVMTKHMRMSLQSNRPAEDNLLVLPLLVIMITTVLDNFYVMLLIH